jgi:tetratricopeptide (TPR) repeat protein
MKTTATIILCIVLATSGFCNEDKYQEVMKKAIEALYQAETPESIQQSVNTFERISDAEKTKWEPHYYASFGYIQMAMKETDPAKKDFILDQALAALNKAKEINPNDSEVVTMEGFIYMIRVTVDPASRGPQYIGMVMQLFGKALSINPDNPRALAMMAQMQFGTAKFMGTPVTEACATVDKSLEKFATFRSENPLAPQWGRSSSEELKKQCP